MANQKAPSENIVLEHVKLSFAHGLLTPYAFEEGAPLKYGCQVLIPKGTPAAVAAQAAFDRVKGQAKDAIFEGRLGGVKVGLRDGDDDDRQPVEEYPDHEGMLFLNITANTKPGIVDAMLRKVDDEAEVYSGRWANVAITVKAFNYKNVSKGITGYLQNVQLLEDDEPLGGVGPKAEDQFERVQLTAADEEMLG